jgi:hypothetical protein
MTKITKAQLAAQLEAAHVAYEALLTKYESLLASPPAFAPVPLRERPVYTPPVNTEREARDAAFKLACAKAREAAMSNGRSVRVG